MESYIVCPVFLVFPGLFEVSCIAQKMKFSIKDFFSKCDQIRSFLQIWSHIMKIFLMENFICCAALSKVVVSFYTLFISIR